MFAQNLDYLSNALRVLDSSSDNQYGIRGQPRFDKVRRIRFSLISCPDLAPTEHIVLSMYKV